MKKGFIIPGPVKTARKTKRDKRETKRLVLAEGREAILHIEQNVRKIDCTQ